MPRGPRILAIEDGCRAQVVIDEAVINGQAEPYLIYQGNMQARAAAAE